MPASGHCQSPCDATTSSVPRKGAVHVNDVSVNVSAISSVPAATCRAGVRPSSRVTTRDGSASS